MGVKFISLDLETTGIPEKDGIENIQALQIGAILEDTDNPKTFEDCEKFQCIIEQPNGYYGGNPYALNLNAWILKILGDQEKLKGDELKEYRKKYNIISIENVAEELYKWILKIGYDESYNIKVMNSTGTDTIEEAIEKLTFKGRLAPKLPRLYFNVAGKNFDNFDRLFMEIFPRWKSFLAFRGLAIDPGNVCFDFNIDKRTPGLQTLKDRYGIKGVVTHDAIEDAFDVIQVLRKKYKS